VAYVDGSPASGRVGFSYDDAYLRLPGAAPLSVSVSLQPGRHEIGVWIDGLLSDNPLVRARWRLEFSASSTRAVDLLATSLGRDCAGAVQFCPTGEESVVTSRGGGTRLLASSRVSSAASYSL